MTEWTPVWRLLISAGLAGCIGYERERHGRAAGLRTHVLVGVGACLVMLTDLFLVQTLPPETNVDASRMASQVISGIGFLGAGTILRFRASVRGLTTAASLWAVAGMGLAVGAGFLVGAVASTAIILVVLFGLARFERRIRKDWYRVLVIESTGSADEMGRIRQVLSEHDVEIRDLDVKRPDGGETALLELNLRLVSERDEPSILSDVLRLGGTRRAHWA